MKEYNSSYAYKEIWDDFQIEVNILKTIISVHALIVSLRISVVVLINGVTGLEGYCQPELYQTPVVSSTRQNVVSLSFPGEDSMNR